MNLPTDNLYKFLALSGLVVIGYSNYYFKKSENELSQNVYVLKTEIDEHAIRVEALKDTGKRFRELLDNTIADQSGTYERDPKKLELEYTDDEIKEIQNKIRESLMESQIQTSKYKNSNNRLLKLQQELEWLRVLYKIATAAGFILTVIGFRLWYTRVQKPQDSLLREQID